MERLAEQEAQKAEDRQVLEALIRQVNQADNRPVLRRKIIDAVFGFTVEPFLTKITQEVPEATLEDAANMYLELDAEGLFVYRSDIYRDDRTGDFVFLSDKGQKEYHSYYPKQTPLAQ